MSATQQSNYPSTNLGKPVKMEKKENLKSTIQRFTASILAVILLGQSAFAYNTTAVREVFLKTSSGQSASNNQKYTEANSVSNQVTANSLVKRTANVSGKTNQIIISAEENEGIIGVYAGKLLDNPADNLFHFNIKEILKAEDRVKLVYELQGVSDYHGVAISINDEW